MRIAIDARELAGQPTGVGRYLSEILREWESLPDARAHEFVFCAPAPMTYSGSLGATVSVASGRGTLWEQRTLPKLARQARADVLFCPGYSGPIFDSTPLVVAIHDVSFAAHPEWFRWREGLRRRLVTRAAARRGARVLTLTEFSKREIIEHLGITPDRVEVIYPGVVAQPFSGAGGVAHPFRDAESLVLYVGSIFNRRHVPEAITAVERLGNRYPSVRIAIVGDNRSFPRIDLDRVIHSHERVDVHPYIADEALADLYRRARAFVFLSEYEGFALTPLEALATGIPVVLLDTPVAREVFGDAALYVPDPDPRYVEPALEAALFDESVRARVLAAAREVTGRYSWSDCARRVLQAIVGAAK
jgi:glycosyltransferase involved in cell wall biosynthesis